MTIEEAAAEVVRTFRAWQAEDGIFPDPEYDNCMEAVDRLEELLADRPVVTD